MKHIHFTQSLEVDRGGGLASSALSLHQAMVDSELDSSLVSTICRQSNVRFSGEIQNVRLYKEFIKSPFFISLTPYSDRNIRSLAACYHSHGLHTFIQYFFRYEKLSPAAHLVIHPHGFLEPYIVARSRWKKKVVGILFENSNFENAALWRALTSVEKQQILRHFPNSNVSVIPNGVSIPVLSSRDRSLERLYSFFPSLHGVRKIILYLGRLHPKKGVDNLICAFSSLPEAFSDYHLIIAGSGELAYVNHLLQLAREVGASQRISFVGSVAGETKNAIYNSASIFVLPSHSEGLPMALLEACSYSLPVLYTHSCNVSELSQNSAGWLVDSDRGSLLSGLNLALARGPSELALRGKALREYVSRHYSWERVASALHSQCINLGTA